MKALTGQTITIKSQAGKNGLAGLKVKNSSHSGKNELDVSDKAAILDGTSNAVSDYVDANKVNAQLAHSKGSIQDAKRILFQKAQLYVECIKAAAWINGQQQLSAEHFQAAVASLFISADKQNLASCFPVESVKSPKSVAADDEIPMDFAEADAAAAKPKDTLEEELGW
jgi:hypothetical protein